MPRTEPHAEKGFEAVKNSEKYKWNYKKGACSGKWET
jgi:hypothetical protein